MLDILRLAQVTGISVSKNEQTLRTHVALLPYNVLSNDSTVKHTDKETKETTELIKDVATNNKSAPQLFLYTFLLWIP